MLTNGDGTLQRRINDGVCPRCEAQMRYTADGLEQDYMTCYVCNLVMLTPVHAELDIVVELED